MLCLQKISELTEVPLMLQIFMIQNCFLILISKMILPLSGICSLHYKDKFKISKPISFMELI